MALAADIDQLLTQPTEQRDLEWERAFLHLLPTTKFKILHETPIPGSDGWPYLVVKIERDGTELAAKVLNWLSDKGVGLVINPGPSAPDYVLTYGMIWNFRERGEFLSNLTENADEKYLPSYARLILRSFFKDNGISTMRFLILSKGKNKFDLCFSLESMGSPAESERKGILEAISWFLPGHYALMLVSEEGLPEFHEL